MIVNGSSLELNTLLLTLRAGEPIPIRATRYVPPTITAPSKHSLYVSFDPCESEDDGLETNNDNALQPPKRNSSTTIIKNDQKLETLSRKASISSIPSNATLEPIFSSNKNTNATTIPISGTTTNRTLLVPPSPRLSSVNTSQLTGMTNTDKSIVIEPYNATTQKKILSLNTNAPSDTSMGITNLQRMERDVNENETIIVGNNSRNAARLRSQSMLSDAIRGTNTQTSPGDRESDGDSGFFATENNQRERQRAGTAVSGGQLLSQYDGASTTSGNIGRSNLFSVIIYLPSTDAIELNIDESSTAIDIIGLVLRQLKEKVAKRAELPVGNRRTARKAIPSRDTTSTTSLPILEGDITHWELRLHDEGGLPDEDFPPLDRTRPVRNFGSNGMYEFVLCPLPQKTTPPILVPSALPILSTISKREVENIQPAVNTSVLTTGLQQILVPTVTTSSITSTSTNSITRDLHPPPSPPISKVTDLAKALAHHTVSPPPSTAISSTNVSNINIIPPPPSVIAPPALPARTSRRTLSPGASIGLMSNIEDLTDVTPHSPPLPPARVISTLENVNTTIASSPGRITTPPEIPSVTLKEWAVVKVNKAGFRLHRILGIDISCITNRKHPSDKSFFYGGSTHRASRLITDIEEVQVSVGNPTVFIITFVEYSVSTSVRYEASSANDRQEILSNLSRVLALAGHDGRIHSCP